MPLRSLLFVCWMRRVRVGSNRLGSRAGEKGREMYPVVRLETQATGCGFPGDRTALVAGRILIPKPSGKKEKRKVSTAIGLSEGKAEPEWPKKSSPVALDSRRRTSRTEASIFCSPPCPIKYPARAKVGLVMLGGQEKGVWGWPGSC